MKSLLIILTLASSFSALAKCASKGEGQLHPTKIKKVVMHEEGCRALPQSGVVDSNPLCPFDDSSIMSVGIEVGVDIKGECNYAVGDFISGNLINNEEGKIEKEGIVHRRPADCKTDPEELKPTKPLLKILPQLEKMK